VEQQTPTRTPDVPVPAPPPRDPATADLLRFVGAWLVGVSLRVASEAGPPPSRDARDEAAQ
jgi:hypothetical protein